MPTQPTTNNLEGWEERWKEFSSSIKRTLVVYDKNADAEICALCGVNADKLGENIKQFISDLRKHDELELIKIFNGSYDENVRMLIEDYYDERRTK